MISQRLNSIKDALQSFAPSRIVGRSLRDLGQISDADLRRGVYTLVCRNESDFAEYMGREAELGTLQLALVGQIRVDDGLDAVAIEDAELAMASEIKAFIKVTANNGVPGSEGVLMLTRWQQSGQLEYPYGWIVFDMTWRE